MREVILPPLEIWQQEVFDVVKDAQNSGKRFIIKAKRQVGKSILCIVLLIYYSLNKKGISFNPSIIVSCTTSCILFSLN